MCMPCERRVRDPGPRYREVGVCLMHMQGEPRTMQDRSRTTAMWWPRCASFCRTSGMRASQAGIAREAIVLDPGLGFGKGLRTIWPC